jgi:hypothetical protein
VYGLKFITRSREVRDHEERNKNRETILEQLDRRIRSGS